MLPLIGLHRKRLEPVFVYKCCKVISVPGRFRSEMSFSYEPSEAPPVFELLFQKKLVCKLNEKSSKVTARSQIGKLVHGL